MPQKQLTALPTAADAADDDLLIKRDASSGTDEKLPISVLREPILDRANHTGTQTLASISQSGATDGQFPMWDDALGEWSPSDISASGAAGLGSPFPVFDQLVGVDAPDNSGSEKYIKLTAGEDGAGQYNEGLLTNESVTGTAPLVVATAEIATGPMAGQTVNLLNTEGRYVQPGESSGAVANDQMQQITGEFSPRDNTGADVESSSPLYAGAFSPGQLKADGSASSNSPGSSLVFDSSNSPNARTGDYTNVKHAQATFYMRIA